MNINNLGCFQVETEETKEIFYFTKLRSLFGKDSKCDFIFDYDGIFQYHLFLEIKDDCLRVINLVDSSKVSLGGASSSQVFFIFPGDFFIFDNFKFTLLGLTHTESDSNVFVNQPLAPLQDERNFILYDDEKCFVQFDDSKIPRLNKSPLDNFFISDHESLTSLDSPFVISSEKSQLRLEYNYFIQGNLIEVKYLDLIDGEFFLGTTTDHGTLLFSSLQKEPFFKIANGVVVFNFSPDLFTSAPDGSLSDEAIFFSRGVEQISLRLTHSKYAFSPLPFLTKDKDSYKLIGKNSSFLMSMILLVLFFRTHKVDIKEDKEIPVVFEAELTTDLQDKAQGPSSSSLSKASLQKSVKKISDSQVSDIKPNLEDFDPSEALKNISVTKDSSRQPSSQISSTRISSGTVGESGDFKVSKFSGDSSRSMDTGTRGLSSKKSFNDSVDIIKTKVMGSIDPELLRRILREYLPQFKHCYQSELVQKNDSLSGVVDLDFTINAEGKVTKYDLISKNMKFSTKGKGCVGHVLSLIDFPRPKGGGVVDVRQPLNFFSESEKI